MATVGPVNDLVGFNEIPVEIQGGLDRAWLAFIVTDNQVDEEDADPVQRVYLTRPDNGRRVEVIELTNSTNNQIYWSPTGLHMAYFVREEGISGLYLLDVQSGRSRRLYASESLQPRGIGGHQPVWSPDGTRLAFVLPTAYATDVYLVNADGTGFSNLTNSPSYDFWPSWSTDGQKLAFVSDRVFCPTWQPQYTNTCDRPDATPPTTGHLFVYDFSIRRLDRITDNTLNSPPNWINERLVSVSQGSIDPFSDESELWVYDVEAGSVWQVSPDDNALYGAPAWTTDGQRVVFQRIATTSSIMLTGQYGDVIARQSEYTFIRLGMAADWAPDGELVVIGGSNGQCPYGLIVMEADFTPVREPVENLLACDPIFDPSGQYLAFSGIQVARGTDGREDIYITANPGGLNPRNATRDLEGIIQILGWVGPTFQ